MVFLLRNIAGIARGHFDQSRQAHYARVISVYGRQADIDTKVPLVEACERLAEACHRDRALVELDTELG